MQNKVKSSAGIQPNQDVARDYDYPNVLILVKWSVLANN
jgi:hypothetical protein